MNLRRERIFYGRPPRTARGKIHYGLPLDRELSRILELTADPLNTAPGPEKLLATIFPDMIRRGELRGSAARITAMKAAMRDLQANHDRTKYGLLLHRALSRAVGS